MPALNPTRLQDASYIRTIHSISPEQGVPFEELLKPEYWVHVAARLRPCDRIEIYPEDGSYFAELFVRDCSRLWAKVALLRKDDFADAVQIAEGEPAYKVEWAGPSLKYSVVRIADKERVQSGFGTKEDAFLWKDQHEKTLAA